MQKILQFHHGQDFKIYIFRILTSNPTTWLKQNLCLFLSSKNCLQPPCGLDPISMTSPSAWVKLTRFLLSSTYPIQANEALTSRLIRSPRTESLDQNRFCLSSRLLCAHTRLLLTLSWSLSTRNVFSALVAQAAGLIKSSCT